MRALPNLLAAMALLVATAVCAAPRADPASVRYRWVDAHGLAHYSDSPAIAALRHGYVVINAQGFVIKRVKAELSPTARSLAQAQASAREAAHAKAAQQLEHDRQMLAAYPTLGSYRDALNARLTNRDAHIHTTGVNLASQQRSLVGLLEHAADLQSAGHAVPAAFRKRIEKRRQAVLAQRGELARQRTERELATRDHAARLAHYRTVSGD